MTDDRGRKGHSAADEFEEQRRQRIVTARLAAIALALAVLLAVELRQRTTSDIAQTSTPIARPSDLDSLPRKGSLK